MKHNLVTRKSVEDYNAKYDDELVFEEVVKQVERDLDLAVESLCESIEELKESFYQDEHKHNYQTEYLNIPSGLIDNSEFVGAVLSAVQVMTPFEEVK